MNSEITHIVLIVVTDLAKQEVVQALLAADYHVTEIGSTGSLFTTGFASLLIGVTADQVEEVLHIVRQNCHTAFDPGEKRAIAYVLRANTFAMMQPQEEAAPS